MVKITNGKQVLTVTHNAYKDIFKRSGFRLYDEVPQEVTHTTHTATQQPSATKPISQWTRKELADYLYNHGYKADGKIDEMREFVKKHMEDAE